MEAKLNKVKDTFDAGKTKPLEWREGQLKAFRQCLLDNEDRFRAALKEDLGKSPFECVIAELSLIYDEIDVALSNVSSWMKPRSVSKPSPKYIWALDSMELFPEPFGVVLVIAPWNYPIQLAISPMVGAIAAGNAVVLKPSEISSACEKVLTEVLPGYVDTSAIEFVTGGKEETQKLLEFPFDYIFFTGSTAVGKVVMKAAAEHLTPVTLELGGKSPAIIDEGVDMKMVCQRLAWGKFTNAGQTCVAPDYVLILPSLVDEFYQQMKKTVTAMFGDEPKASDDFGRIITDSHFDRIVGYLEEGEVVLGGSHDKKTRYIAPTVLQKVDPKADVMQDEIFGPILPVLEVQSMKAAVQFINKRAKPLAMYLFSPSSDVQTMFKERTSSGGLMTNDTLIHLSCNTLPFGGVGDSGMGNYHGKFSFETFTHLKPVLHKSTHMEKANDHFRYPPYTDSKLSHLQTALQYPNK